MQQAIPAPTTTALTVADLNTTVNCEPRILDVRLAQALGYERPADIRPLVERHKEALERFGGIIRTVRKNAGRGRPAQETWLTKKQALFLCTKSETEKATEVTIQMVEIFDAYTSAQTAALKARPRLPAKPRLRAFYSRGLRSFPIDADTMQPTLRKGDFVLVSLVNTYRGEGMYVVGWHGPQVFRVDATGSKIRMWSDNDHYATHDVTPDWFRENVIGKVVFTVNCVDRRLTPDPLKH